MNDQAPAAAKVVDKDERICHNTSDSDDDDESWQELSETGNGQEDDDESAVTCLFCSQQLANIQPAGVEHLRQEHDFDLSALASKFEADCYWFIKVQ